MQWRKLVLLTAVSGLCAVPALAQTSGGRGTVSGTAAGYGGTGNSGNPKADIAPPKPNAPPDSDVNAKGNDPHVGSSQQAQGKKSSKASNQKGTQSSFQPNEAGEADQSNPYVGARPEQSQGSGGTGGVQGGTIGPGSTTAPNLEGQRPQPSNTGHTSTSHTGSSSVPGGTKN